MSVNAMSTGELVCTRGTDGRECYIDSRRRRRRRIHRCCCSICSRCCLTQHIPHTCSRIHLSMHIGTTTTRAIRMPYRPKTPYYLCCGAVDYALLLDAYTQIRRHRFAPAWAIAGSQPSPIETWNKIVQSIWYPLRWNCKRVCSSKLCKIHTQLVGNLAVCAPIYDCGCVADTLKGAATMQSLYCSSAQECNDIECAGCTLLFGKSTFSWLNDDLRERWIYMWKSCVHHYDVRCGRRLLLLLLWNEEWTIVYFWEKERKTAC